MTSVLTDYVHGRTTLNQWDWDKYARLQKILRRLEELDAALGEPECVDDRKDKRMGALAEQLRQKYGELKSPVSVDTYSGAKWATSDTVDSRPRSRRRAPHPDQRRLTLHKLRGFCRMKSPDGDAASPAYFEDDYTHYILRVSTPGSTGNSDGARSGQRPSRGTFASG
jgi:hypothetical protein